MSKPRRALALAGRFGTLGVAVTIVSALELPKLLGIVQHLTTVAVGACKHPTLQWLPRTGE